MNRCEHIKKCNKQKEFLKPAKFNKIKTVNNCKNTVFFYRNASLAEQIMEFIAANFLPLLKSNYNRKLN